MEMGKGRERFRRLAVLLLLSALVNAASSAAASAELPTNHKLAENHSDTQNIEVSKLKMEARIEENEGLDLTKFEDTETVLEESAPTASMAPISDVSQKERVSYVIARSEPGQFTGDSMFGHNGRQSEVSSGKGVSVPVVTASPEDRGLRTMRDSSDDSYLKALDHSHANHGRKESTVQVKPRPRIPKITRRDYQEGPVYRPEAEKYGPPIRTSNSIYGVPDYQSGPIAPEPTQAVFLPTPSHAYSLPVHSYDNFAPQSTYGSPQASYGAPATTYQPQQSSYGHQNQVESVYGAPSQNIYGPPAGSYSPVQAPQQAYGPPAPTYGAPYALPTSNLPSFPMMDFSWPFALKLNAFTLAKILLKLVIFKMIVKFIAVICLLLFIPKLEIVKQNEKNDYDEEGRATERSMGRLNFLTSMVMSSIDKYAGEQPSSNESNNCTSFACRLRKGLTSEESWSDYLGLFKNYVIEEEQNATERNRVEHGTKAA